MLLFRRAKAAKFGFIFIFWGEGGKSEKLLALSAAFHQKKIVAQVVLAGFSYSRVFGV